LNTDGSIVRKGTHRANTLPPQVSHAIFRRRDGTSNGNNYTHTQKQAHGSIVTNFCIFSKQNLVFPAKILYQFSAKISILEPVVKVAVPSAEDLAQVIGNWSGIICLTRHDRDHRAPYHARVAA
jgi:hypothetical protein